MRFTTEQRLGLRDFWNVYDANYDEVEREVISLLARRPNAAHAFKSEALARVMLETRDLVRMGVEQDDWSQYEARIRSAGVRLARDGVPFDGWHAVVRTLDEVVTAKLVDSFVSDAPRLKAALHAMRRFWDGGLAVVDAEFIEANESAALAHAAHDKKSSAEETRTRLARELHDELGQQLTALKLDLGWLLRRHNTNERDGVAERLLAMTELVNDTLQTVREIATRLRLPDVIDERGLIDALTSLAREVETRSGLHFHLSFPVGKDLRVPVEPATAIFAAFQEIITNVVRHAGAKNVHVSLERTAGGLWLEVEDDGRGITSAQATGGGSLGLVGVRERIAMVRGTVDVDGVNGTRVRVTVPFGEDSAT